MTRAWFTVWVLAGPIVVLLIHVVAPWFVADVDDAVVRHWAILLVAATLAPIVVLASAGAMTKRSQSWFGGAKLAIAVAAVVITVGLSIVSRVDADARLEATTLILAYAGFVVALRITEGIVFGRSTAGIVTVALGHVVLTAPFALDGLMEVDWPVERRSAIRDQAFAVSPPVALGPRLDGLDIYRLPGVYRRHLVGEGTFRYPPTSLGRRFLLIWSACLIGASVFVGGGRVAGRRFRRRNRDLMRIDGDKA